MTIEPDLTVIIPVHNASSTIAGIVDEFQSMSDLRTEIILVDDCSTDESKQIITDLDDRYDDVTAMFHRRNHGAGVARNTGFAASTGRYTLFFDADDIPHAEAIAAAVPSLDDTGADLAVMPYRYRRGALTKHESMNSHDIEIWDSYVGGAGHRLLQLDEAPRLLRFSNYPWNKIHRTETYREAGIRFGSTPVNNDILGHWYAFLFASTILLIDQEICTHIVLGEGANLSNRHSRVRLSLFDAFDETYDLLESVPHLRNRYSHHYWASVIRTAAWAQDRIAPELTQEFNLRLQQHLMRINLADYARIRLKRDPALANAIVRKALA